MMVNTAPAVGTLATDIHSALESLRIAAEKVGQLGAITNSLHSWQVESILYNLDEASRTITANA